MSLPLLNAGRVNPGLSPKLDLRFALDKSLTAYRGPTPSFSRASTGTYFNSSGVLTSAAINGARFDHTYNGTSWVSRGLLVEEQRTNINLWSEQFNDAAYSKNQGAIVANQVAAPDGSTTADKFTASAGTVNPNVYQSVTTASASVYTFSIFVKKNTHDFVQIVLNGVANGYVNFDIANGAVGTVGAGGSATASIINSGSGWYRCVITYTTASTAGNGYINLIESATAGRGATFSAAGTESVYLWGQQLELGSFSTSYIGTTNSSVVRSADVCQITGTDFSGFWNGTEGTFAVDFDRNGTPSSGSYTPFIYSASGSPANANWISLRQDGTTGTNQFYVVNSGSTQAQINSGTFPGSSISCRNSSAYKLNDFASSDNGALPITDTSGTVPSASTLDIGYLSGFAGPPYALNGHIARLRYYNQRLPNATLQKLST